MEKQIKEVIKLIFNNINDNQFKVNKRLMGGMSNYTYLIEVNGLLYTIRIPGEYSTNFVSRKDELKNIKLFESLKITNNTIYFDEDNGIKISQYIHGKSLNEDNVIIDYRKVSELLKKIHNSKELSHIDYNPWERLEIYEKYNEELHYEYPIKYFDLKNELLSYKEYLDKQKKCLCHNDSQPSNFILKDDNEFSIVDFEFVGNNDPLYDIACFGNISMDQALKLLNEYYDNITPDIFKRLYLWRGYQCIQWFNVAMFKHLVGLDKSLNLPFDVIALNYLKLLEDNLNKVKNINNE